MTDDQHPVLSDISGRYGDRKSLELLMRSILASVPDAMIVINDSGQIMAFSAAAERLFGYLAKDVAGRNVSILMDDNHRKHHDQYIENYMSTGERQIIGIGRIVEAKLSDGRVIPVELKIGEADIDGEKLFTG
ncbi:MAG: PAS domain S-box protein, partial [Pseudomonadota bacterium]